MASRDDWSTVIAARLNLSSSLSASTCILSFCSYIRFPFFWPNSRTRFLFTAKRLIWADLGSPGGQKEIAFVAMEKLATSPFRYYREFPNTPYCLSNCLPVVSGSFFNSSSVCFSSSSIKIWFEDLGGVTNAATVILLASINRTRFVRLFRTARKVFWYGSTRFTSEIINYCQI